MLLCTFVILRREHDTKLASHGLKVLTLNDGNVSFGLSDSLKELNVQAQLRAERISLRGQQTLFF